MILHSQLKGAWSQLNMFTTVGTGELLNWMFHKVNKFNDIVNLTNMGTSL